MTAKQCGARTRRGTPCQLPPVPGKRRCRLHGGLSTGAHRPVTLHGAYGGVLTDEERELAGRAAAGLLDEIVVARVQLARALRAQTELDGAPVESLAADERVLTDAPTGLTVTVRQKRPDMAALIDRLLGRIGRLAEQRARILALAAGDTGPTPEQQADRIRQLLVAADDATVGGEP